MLESRLEPSGWLCVRGRELVKAMKASGARAPRFITEHHGAHRSSWSVDVSARQAGQHEFEGWALYVGTRCDCVSFEAGAALVPHSERWSPCMLRATVGVVGR